MEGKKEVSFCYLSFLEAFILTALVLSNFENCPFESSKLARDGLQVQFHDNFKAISNFIPLTELLCPINP